MDAGGYAHVARHGRKKDFHEIRSPFLQLQILAMDFKLCCIFSKHGYRVLDFVPKLGEIISKARSLSSFLQKCQRKGFQDLEICHRTFFLFFFFLVKQQIYCPDYTLLELIFQ